jgi:SAM-dependent methyltransferase
MTVRPANTDVIWHDLECGAYAADLPVWRELAAAHDGPVLDVGAGTGRVSLDLARQGHEVLALDRDPALLAELERRGSGLPVEVVYADAREFSLEQRFGLIIVPMQTIQLLGGAPGRRGFLIAAQAHLRTGGSLALAITEVLDLFPSEAIPMLPLPDIQELDDVVYSSQPTAVREEPGGFVLERLRERVGPEGERLTELDVIRLDRLTASELEAEAGEVGLPPRDRLIIPETNDHVGSVMVVLGG